MAAKKMNMEAMMKECMKPHALAHGVSGFGVAMLLVALVPSLAMYALVVGLVALVGGIVWDMMAQKML